jgi:hypothetical protein
MTPDLKPFNNHASSIRADAAKWRLMPNPSAISSEADLVVQSDLSGTWITLSEIAEKFFLDAGEDLNIARPQFGKR